MPEGTAMASVSVPMLANGFSLSLNGFLFRGLPFDLFFCFLCDRLPRVRPLLFLGDFLVSSGGSSFTTAQAGGTHLANLFFFLPLTLVFFCGSGKPEMLWNSSLHFCPWPEMNGRGVEWFRGSTKNREIAFFVLGGSVSGSPWPGCGQLRVFVFLYVYFEYAG